MNPSPTRRPRAFTLVELLVSMVVLSIIMFVSASFVSQTQKTWTQSSARVEQFREARMAFETLTKSLRQATLNPYLTYVYNSGTTPTVPASKDEAPQSYLRHSELQFACGPVSDLLPSSQGGNTVTHAVFFQAPMGVTERDGYEALNRLLCGRGYFIMESDDSAFRPAHVTKNRLRFRLWEYRPPAERNAVYANAGSDWFSNAASQVVTSSETASIPSYSRPVAENIVALVISPRVTKADAELTARDPEWIAPNYAYDSKSAAGATSSNPQGTQHLLPPMLQVTLVAVDEASAARLVEDGSTAALVPATAFKACRNFEPDLAALETALIARKANYRVFSATVALRNSKWNLIP